MAEIGRMNRLRIKRIRDYGAHLDGGESGDVIVPKKYVPKRCRPGDEIEVFVYVDREDRLLATTRRPLAMVGQFAGLRVTSSSPSGAYLDWGLQKDLFVPKSEQQTIMEEGKLYAVFLFFDTKANRIIASSKLDRFLGAQTPDYEEGEEVDLFICDETDLGYKAIVNNSNWGIVYKNEVFQKLEAGMRLKGFIKKIRSDLKIDIGLQQSGYERVDAVSRSILRTIKDRGGSIALTDKSPPEEIYSLLGVSKKTFKKAIGALYRKRLITIDSDGVNLVRKGD